MVSRRNFVAITIIMAIVLFLFQGLNVAREKLNYYFNITIKSPIIP